MISRFLLVSAALVAASLGIAAAPAGAKPAAKSCRKPAGLRVVQVAPAKVVLRWRTPRRGRFRVLRGTRVVGQTTRHSMRVNLRPGRKVKLAVGLVRPRGRGPRCYRRVTAHIRKNATPQRPARGKDAPPTATLPAPANLRIERVADGVATIAWDAAPGAKRYRVDRDGATLGSTAAEQYAVRVRAGHTATVAVASVAGDRIGPRSAPITVRTDRRPPDAPQQLRAESVTPFGLVLRWERGGSGSAPIRGFRVARNGKVVSQVPQTSLRVTGLVPSTRYTLTVKAIDTQGLPSAPATLQVETPPPDPTSGSIHAFLLASTSASFADFREHYQRVGTLYPTYFDCDPAHPSVIRGEDDPQVTSFAQARKVPVLPRYDCQNLAALRKVIGDPETGRTVIAGLVDLVRRHGYDGLNLDIESGAPSDRDALSAFVAALADELHAIGARLTVDVSPKVRDVRNHPRSSFYDYAAIAQKADTVLVMAWGLHWSTSAPGPLVDLTWLRQVAAYVQTIPGAERFVIATATYGFDWPAGGGPAHKATALGYDDLQALIAATGAQPVRDPASQEMHFTYTDASGIGHDVWYRDATSTSAALEVARGHGLGFAFWRLGQEDQATWNSL